MRLYHLATPDEARTIEATGFVDGAGTYKATGLDLAGVFFSSAVLDSNEDRAGSIVIAIDLDDALLAHYEIIEATSDHRTFSIPADVANGVPAMRLSADEAQTLPVADRRTDPAFPHES